MNVTNSFSPRRFSLLVLFVLLGFALPASAQPCPAGTYSPDGMVDKEMLCDPGYYTSFAGQMTETPAPPGGYVTNAGSTNYTPCSPGYYTSGSASIVPT